MYQQITIAVISLEIACNLLVHNNIKKCNVRTELHKWVVQFLIVCKWDDTIHLRNNI